MTVGVLGPLLSQNGLGAAATATLGESEHLRGLLVLRLLDNRINEQAATALSASPLSRCLSVLELENLPASPEPPLVGEGDIPF